MWADAIPNLLIGLREGLEAGLVVSILLAALRKAEPADGAASRRMSSAPVWLGVLGAVMLAGSFAAVLTYSTNVPSSRAQEAVGGLLSVCAVGLVTGMVFWMRRTAAGLAAHLRGEVQRAVAIGAGALTITAFLAVGREGLETTLFLWAAVRASGATFAPPPRLRRPLGRQQRVRRSGLRRRPARERDRDGRAYPAGQPAHQGHRRPAAYPPLVHLRPGPGPERQPAGRAPLRGLPARRSPAVRDHPGTAGGRTAHRLRPAVRRRLLLHPARRPGRVRLVRPLAAAG